MPTATRPHHHRAHAPRDPFVGRPGTLTLDVQRDPRQSPICVLEIRTDNADDPWEVDLAFTSAMSSRLLIGARRVSAGLRLGNDAGWDIEAGERTVGMPREGEAEIDVDRHDALGGGEVAHLTVWECPLGVRRREPDASAWITFDARDLSRLMIGDMIPMTVRISRRGEDGYRHAASDA